MTLWGVIAFAASLIAALVGTFMLFRTRNPIGKLLAGIFLALGALLFVLALTGVQPGPG